MCSATNSSTRPAGRRAARHTGATAFVRRTTAVLLLACLPLAAAVAASVDELADLVSDGDFDAAYEQAVNLRDEHAGEPAFDYYYGIAAIEKGRLSEGIFALERALIARPGFDQARLELARALFLRGNDRQARTEFETVRAHDPPDNVAARIDRYLLAIQRRADRYETTVSGHIELGGGYDSNVNSATSSESVETVVGRISLADNRQEQSDSFARVDAAARVSHPVSPDVNVIGSLGGSARGYSDEDEFNTATVDGQFGMRLQREDWRLQAMVDVLRFYLDGDTYRDQAGIQGLYRASLGKRSAADVNAAVFELDYDTQDFLDSTLWVVGAGLTHTLGEGAGPTVNVGAYVGGEQADENGTRAQANADRDILGVQGSVRTWLAPEWTFRAEAEARLSDYSEADVLFDESREEEFYRVETAFDWHPTARWRVGPQLRLSANESNIDLYEYERAEVQLRARYDFY